MKPNPGRQRRATHKRRKAGVQRREAAKFKDGLGYARKCARDAKAQIEREG